MDERERIGYWRETKDGRGPAPVMYGRVQHWLDGRPQMAQLPRTRPLAEMLPWPGDLVDPNWDLTERDAVLRYLRRKSHEWRAWRGVSRCRLCGRENGSCDVSDGVYVWPSGLAHYVERHQVRLPEAFVRHVRERSG